MLSELLFVFDLYVKLYTNCLIQSFIHLKRLIPAKPVDFLYFYVNSKWLKHFFSTALAFYCKKKNQFSLQPSESWCQV